MAKPRKDGERISIYFERSILNRLRNHAEEKGQTMTMALERIVESYLNELERKY
ncbi:hypothetical protein AAK882_02710 [Carnobacteriaceae bacterium 52-44]